MFVFYLNVCVQLIPDIPSHVYPFLHLNGQSQLHELQAEIQRYFGKYREEIVTVLGTITFESNVLLYRITYCENEVLEYFCLTKNESSLQQVPNTMALLSLETI